MAVSEIKVTSGSLIQTCNHVAVYNEISTGRMPLRMREKYVWVEHRLVR